MLIYDATEDADDAPHLSGDTSKLPEAIRKERGLKEGENWDETMFNVFRLDSGTVRHFWGSELRGHRWSLASIIDPATR